MSLDRNPEVVRWGTTHYVFVEKVGPFNETASKSWKELHALVPEIASKNKIEKYLTEYKVGKQAVYRAGLSVAEAPTDLPANVRYEELPGGIYVGPYTGLPVISGEVWSHVREKEIPVRDDFTLEYYLKDPGATPEGELVTEILIPMM